MTPLLIFFAALAYITTAVRENLGKLFKNEAATKYEAIWIKLHTGNPGTEGKSNVSTEATRKKITFTGTSLLKNNAEIKWASVTVTGTEKILYVSFWSAESAGTFYGYSTEIASPPSVVTGENLVIAAEGLEWPIT